MKRGGLSALAPFILLRPEGQKQRPRLLKAQAGLRMTVELVLLGVRQFSRAARLAGAASRSYLAQDK